MGYTISIKDISYNQMREINNKLAAFGSGLSATSVDDKGERWGSFKVPMYVDKNKQGTFYKLMHKKGAALPQKYTEDAMPTGYCADYCFYEAYAEFLDLARKHPDTITLADFCNCLARHFEKEYQADYEQATSIDYAMEFLCQDNYYTWHGKDITDIVNAYMVAK